jgi:hypothetical protein
MLLLAAASDSGGYWLEAAIRAFFASRTNCLSTRMDFFRSKAWRVSEISNVVRIPAEAFEIRLRFVAMCFSVRSGAEFLHHRSLII